MCGFLVSRLTSRTSGSAILPQDRLRQSLKALFVSTDTAIGAVAPIEVLNNLRSFAPQFAETDGRGNFAQQGMLSTSGKSDTADADEAWTLLITALRNSSSTLDAMLDQYMSLELCKT